MDLIVPCAGLSTRFPGEIPKYLWPAGPEGRPMIHETISSWVSEADTIRVAVLREHVEHHRAEEVILAAWPEADVLVLEKPTSGSAETVALLAERCTGHILVRDPDAAFQLTNQSGNFIAVCPASDYPHLHNVSAKSYVSINDQGLVVSIIEKHVVSDYFACGGFHFAYAQEYLAAYAALKGGREPYVSHVIEEMLRQGHVFQPLYATQYVDYGTYESWKAEQAR